MATDIGGLPVSSSPPAPVSGCCPGPRRRRRQDPKRRRERVGSPPPISSSPPVIEDPRTLGTPGPRGTVCKRKGTSPNGDAGLREEGGPRGQRVSQDTSAEVSTSEEVGIPAEVEE
ncbi:hypothetical protein NDU88_010760 [Pleurodeles waltl]|uniref:Uncharacterized protein n=1 Tax=Pleurodeles waltl TaxID=8319 RepID=A0AAV7S2T6_PLEWA|nr:hypothetical protein NDU88_010760 [Pleurodeles waltl]